MTRRRSVAYQMPVSAGEKKTHHIKRRQVTEKVWTEAMVIIIYIGPSDISRTKWRACKTGFSSLVSVHTRSNARVLRNENGATLREKQRMADQPLILFRNNTDRHTLLSE